MHHGPFPDHLDLDAVSDVRARYLVGDHDPAAAVRDFNQRNDQLRAAAQYDQVVLWFEHDLLDQLQLIQLLDWFSKNPLDQTELSLICINKFPGMEIFRGLGELSPQQLASLENTRQPVNDAQLKLATKAWALFRAADPRPLTRFVREKHSDLPFLNDAMLRLFMEYPWTQDGLTRTERQMLKLAALGVDSPGQLFVKNMDFEQHLFIGDWPSYRCIQTLCEAPAKLLDVEPELPFRYQPEDISLKQFRQQKLTISERGKSVLAGKVDATQMLDRNVWLGGVKLLSNNTLWMWDAPQQTIVRRRS